MAQEAQVACAVPVRPAVEYPDEVLDLRLYQGEVGSEHIQRRAARTGHRHTLFAPLPLRAAKVQDRVRLPEDLPHVPRRGQVVVNAAVGNDKGLPPHPLYVYHQVAAELKEEAAAFQARVRAVGGQKPPEALAKAL